MKKFTKLALVSSIALSANAMAMQAMDDAALSTTTGQDGLTIGIGISKITIDKLFIHDNDGLGRNYQQKVINPTTGEVTYEDKASGAGAIYIKGNGIADKQIEDPNDSTKTITVKNEVKDKGLFIGANYDNNGAYLLASRNLADLTIDSDAGNGNPFINIAAAVSGLDIRIGEIGVTASGEKPTATATSIRRGGTGAENAILSGLSLKTGKMTANIQLGASPQGAMIKLDTTIVGGLEILDLGILDNSTKGAIVGSTVVGGNTVAVATREAGEIFIESIKIADADGTNLTVNSDIQVFNTAYVGASPSTTVGKPAHIRIVSNDTGAKDQYIKGIHLGNRNAASIGDVEVQGLQTYYSTAPNSYTKGAVITISGH